MMVYEKRIDEDGIRLTSKLIRLTIEGRLTWNKDCHPITPSIPGELSSAIYTASYEGMSFRMYRITGKRFFNLSGHNPEFISAMDIVLEILDADGDSVQEITNEDIVFRLFDSVRYAASGMKQRVAKLMKEDVTHVQ